MLFVLQSFVSLYETSIKSSSFSIRNIHTHTAKLIFIKTQLTIPSRFKEEERHVMFLKFFFFSYLNQMLVRS
jgi:hypothetical protein